MPTLPSTPFRYQLLIDGRWVEASDGRRFSRESPAHGVIVGGYNQGGLGRELGRQAIEEFTELKTLALHIGPRTNWWHLPVGETVGAP